MDLNLLTVNAPTGEYRAKPEDVQEGVSTRETVGLEIGTSSKCIRDEGELLPILRDSQE